VKPILELIRLETSPEWGTFGVLKLAKALFCVTLEPPWRMNRPNASNIPAGQYLCKRFHSAKFGQTFMVLDVPARDYILFHAGNTDDDTRGCIVLAEYVGKLKGNRAVLNSGATFNRFMGALLGYDEAHLTITEYY